MSMCWMRAFSLLRRSARLRSRRSSACSSTPRRYNRWCRRDCGGETQMATMGILTISTKGAAGGREDASGEAIGELVTAPPFNATIAERAIVADDRATIEQTLRRWADESHLDLILT